MNSIASLSARSSMPRSGSYRTTSTNGSKVTTRKDRIKAAGVSARRRRKHSLTPSPLRGKKRSLPDHHQQRTGHLLKGTVCKIKYKLLQVITAHKRRRRRIEFLDFMNEIAAAYPDTAIHAVLDNLNTHKPKNDRWLKRHPNVHFHFTPTRASWLNQIENWFSILQGNSLKDASFTSVKQLREHIDAFIEAHNENAKAFAWTKSQVYQKRLKARFADQ